ncbi:GGDEF domain-containing protein [Marinobacterium lutimaris]|nr:GGDEF domain-containing protein [Marinobacterium lutimaris]
MDDLVIYFSPGVGDLVEPMKQLLENAGTGTRWLHFDSLIEIPVGAMALLTEAELNEQEQRLLAARQVIVVAVRSDFSASVRAIEMGALSCVSRSNTEQIALQIITLETQRRRMPENVADSGMLQTVIDAIPVPIFFKDQFHIYRGCNVAFSEFLGLPLNQIIGHSVYDVAPPELADRYYRADTELLASGGHQRYEAPVRYADGQEREIEFNKAVFFHADGKPAGQVGAMLDVTERNRLIERLELASLTDPLTGIGNRRQFTRVARTTINRHRETGLPLSLLLLDVDFFKSINDNFGHAVGDRALKFLVEHCRALLRDGDHLFRVGGEEFYLLLEQTSLDEAAGVAERLCDSIRKAGFAARGSQVCMTLSIGVVEVAVDRHLEESLSLADRELYRAKREGRDRVCVADTHEGTV